MYSLFQNYFYIEAVQKLPTNFTPDELDHIFKNVSYSFTGQLRSTFICLSDDAYKKYRSRFVKVNKSPDEGEPEGDAEFQDAEGDPAADAAPPDAVATVVAPSSSTRGGKGWRGKSQKRGADSPLDGPAKK